MREKKACELIRDSLAMNHKWKKGRMKLQGAALWNLFANVFATCCSPHHCRCAMVHHKFLNYEHEQNQKVK